MLNDYLKEQLLEYLALMEESVVIYYSKDNSDEASQMQTFLEEVSALSDKLLLVEKKLARSPSFGLARDNQAARIFFYGIPLGHEFSSFVLALLHVSGRPPQESPEIIAQIKQIKQPLVFETYVKLSCRNCRDAVQALNIMSALNPNITHTMMDGKLCQAELPNKDIQKLPTVLMNDAQLLVGKTSLEEVVAKVIEKIKQEEGI